ncbi:MAG: PAS domain-containing sensor histidine kinase [Aliarcobacter sp.]|nr:PAS domain-containing sensor histidine kinase [Aliarcobacter sp.]
MQKSTEIFMDLNEIINNAIEGILIIKNGFIQNMNQSLLDILGYDDKKELIGNLATGILIPTSKEKFIKYNSKIFQEISIITKNGDIIPVIIKIKDITFSNEEYKMVSILDLTELKEKERMVLLQSKHSAMGEMISMIAHQWRQPLACVSSILSRIKLKNNMNKVDKEFLNTVLDEMNEYIQYMSITIDDFRNFFSIDTKKELLSLPEIVLDVQKLINKSFDSQNINIDIQNVELTKRYLYKNEIIQIIINILNNSRDAFLERNIQNPQIKISFSEDDEFQNIFIEDNAKGIDDKIISNIFNPYFSTKSQKNGSGLGLYICKTILEKNNQGTIKVENKNDGVIFNIIINKF